MAISAPASIFCFVYSMSFSTLPELAMDLGIDGDGHGKGLVLLDKLDQVPGVLEIACQRIEVRNALRRIAAQGQDILDAEDLERAQEPVHRLPGGAYAGQMGHEGEVRFLLQPLERHQRPLLGRSACAVAYRNIERVKEGDVLHDPDDLVLAFDCFRREDLEGDALFALS